jgi:hypothetical protein
MKFALHAPIPSNLPPRTSNLCLFNPLRTLSHSSPVTPLFATLTQINPGWGVAFILSAVNQRFRSSRKGPLVARKFIHLLSFQALPHSFHSCCAQKTPQPLFFLSLPHSCENNGGGGVSALDFFFLQELSVNCELSISTASPPYHCGPRAGMRKCALPEEHLARFRRLSLLERTPGVWRQRVLASPPVRHQGPIGSLWAAAAGRKGRQCPNGQALSLGPGTRPNW